LKVQAGKVVWLCNSAGGAEEFLPKGFFDELAFVRQSALHTDGDSCRTEMNP